MDPAKVAMLAISSGSLKLPPEHEARANDEAWWQSLESTPEEKMDTEQLAFLQALGVDVSGLARSTRPR